MRLRYGLGSPGSWPTCDDLSQLAPRPATYLNPWAAPKHCAQPVFIFFKETMLYVRMYLIAFVMCVGVAPGGGGRR